jgi:hypothetical protein
MATDTEHGTASPDMQVDFDTRAKKGWDAFAKFLFANAAATALGLVFIAALTVWR